MLGAERLELRLDPGVELDEVARDRFQAPELHGDQEAVVLSHLPVQGGASASSLRRMRPLARSATAAGLAAPSASALKHRRAGDAEDVA